MKIFRSNPFKLNKKRLGLYCFSYICVVVPLIIITLTVTYNTTDQLSNEQQKTTQFHMNRVLRELEEMHYSLQNMSMMFVEMPEFIHENIAAHKTHTIDAVKFLGRLANSNKDLREIFVHYKGDDRVYSGYGTTEAGIHFRTVLAMTESVAQEAVSMIQEETNRVQFFSIFSGPSNGYLLFHLPMSHGVFDKGDSMNYVMPISVIARKLSVLGEEKNILIELDFSVGEKCWLYGNHETLHAVAAEELPPMDENTYTKLTVESVQLGLRMTVHYEKAQIFGEIENLRMLNISLLLVGVLCAVMLSYLLGRMRYMQIKKMYSIVSRSDTDAELSDEEQLQQITQQMVDEYDEMEALMAESNSLLRRQVSHMIFSGMLQTEEEILQRMRICGLDFYEQYYTVIAISVKEGYDALDALEENLIGDLYFQTKLGGRRTEMVLLQLPVPDTTREISSVVAEELAELIEKAGGTGVQFAFSNVYADITQIGNAYMEAVCTFEAMDQQEDLSYCVFWENIEQMNAHDLQRTALGQLEKALIARNEQQVLNAWTQIVENCLNEQSEQHYLQYYLLNILAQTVKKENPTDYDCLRLVAHNCTEFLQLAEQLMRSYCRNADQQDSFVRAMEYLNNNYHRYDLSINEVALFADLNRSYLSTLFKQRTGLSYMEYLTQLRMVHVQDLLRNTDLTIREIVQQVGYVDENNFRKKFKSMFGISASEYRKKSRK